MEKSTPINRLPRKGNSQNNDNNLVQDILNEINNGGPEDNNSYNKNTMNENSLNYALDESQMTIPETIPQPPPPQALPPRPRAPPPEQYYESEHELEQPEPEINIEEIENLVKKESLLDRIKKLLKGPLIIFCIVLLITLKPVNDILLKYIPRISSSVTESNNTHILNLCKAIISAVLYFVANNYVQI
jgi:hypothetical protein